VKQDINEVKAHKRLLEKRAKVHQAEVETQEKVGIVSKPKKLGRWKYK